MNIVKGEIAKLSDDAFQLEVYRNLMNDFFAKNYPEINTEQFWDWVLSSLTEKKLSIDCLCSNDLNLFLNELNKVGDNLFNQQILNTSICKP